MRRPGAGRARCTRPESMLLTIGKPRPTAWRASTAGARRSCSSARASTTTSGTRSGSAGASVTSARRAVRRGDGTILISRDAGRHRGRHARQRQHLRHRSARALATPARRHDRDERAAHRRRDRWASGLTRSRTNCGTQQDSLRTLAEETGGFASVSSNDFSTAFQRIVDENSSYYVLGYYPTNDKRDGRFRRDRGAAERGPGSP